MPQGQHPVVDLERGGDCDNQCRGRKEETKSRVHAADIHVVCPHDKTEAADGDNGPDHHAIAENVFASVGGQHIRDHAKGG